MKSFTITEPQLQEIAGRLNTLTVQGLTNNQLIVGILAVLDQVGAAEIKPEPKPDNVIELHEKDVSHG